MYYVLNRHNSSPAYSGQAQANLESQKPKPRRRELECHYNQIAHHNTTKKLMSKSDQVSKGPGDTMYNQMANLKHRLGRTI